MFLFFDGFRKKLQTESLEEQKYYWNGEKFRSINSRNTRKLCNKNKNHKKKKQYLQAAASHPSPPYEQKNLKASKNLNSDKTLELERG